MRRLVEIAQGALLIVCGTLIFVLELCGVDVLGDDIRQRMYERER